MAVAKITELKPRQSLRHEIAESLRKAADATEAADMEPIGFAVIVFTGAPWEENIGSIADWHAPYPKGVFLEGVKIGLGHQMLHQSSWEQG